MCVFALKRGGPAQGASPLEPPFSSNRARDVSGPPDHRSEVYELPRAIRVMARVTDLFGIRVMARVTCSV